MSGLNHGGIALYARCGGILVTHLQHSTVAERSWHVIHSDVGGILLGLWYRPPGAGANDIESFEDELSRLSIDTIGALVIGDMNIWQKSWLKYSPADTVDGANLHRICKEHSLKQLVPGPTRGANLLDLALSSIPAASSAEVLSCISDHASVLVRVDVPMPSIEVLVRTVWDFRNADWTSLLAAFEGFTWDTTLPYNNPDEAAAKIGTTILEHARRYIPRKTICERKGSHPWLDNECLKAIQHKHACQGQASFLSAAQTCTATISAAYSKFIEATRAELQTLKRGSKQWWSMAKCLMDGAGKRTGIPSLRVKDGLWLHGAGEKANAFAETFSKKFTLPAEVDHEASREGVAPSQMCGFVLLRERWVRRELKALRTDQATGPDEIPARILKECASVLCRPLCRILRGIIAQRSWPQIWRFHNIAPLFKKGAVHNAANYRGLHLTPILSKVAERVLRTPLVAFFESVNAYGDTQFAFRKNIGCHDLLLALMCSWLLSFQCRKKVGVFLSDIAGAFDRVDTTKLVAKLKALGVCDAFVELIASYLAPRSAKVIVNGADSAEFVLENMIFQGTVLGPNLWNIFFADVHEPAESTGCKERKFADDLTTFKSFERSTSNDDILLDLASCQCSVHAWGERNRVTFEPSKEEFVVLDPHDGTGGPFRLLGPAIDNKLRMNLAIDKLFRKAKPKARALLRCRRFYDVAEMLCLYKAHVRSQIEWCNSAIYHAARSLLARLDGIQTSFIGNLCLDVRNAFLDFQLAPLELRRDIGMLGALWKIAHGTAHKLLRELFPMCGFVSMLHNTRGAARRHNLRFVDRCVGDQLEQFSRSLFGLVRVWNDLPVYIVEITSVKAFQSKLAQCARKACEEDAVGWASMYSTDSFPPASDSALLRCLAYSLLSPFYIVF